MRLRLLSLLLPCLLLTACAAPEEVETRPKQYQATFLDVFDTVTTVMGYAESQEVFTETAEMAHDLLLEYHQLYDIYNDYEGIHNLKTVNDQAGIAPVTVDARILDLLLLCRDLYADSGGIHLADTGFCNNDSVSAFIDGKRVAVRRFCTER